MARKYKIKTVASCIIFLACLAGLTYIGRGFYYRALTIHELLTENKQLKQAITNLTTEDQIGYAKVISQTHLDGDLFTTIRFVETARNDELTKLTEADYTIQGDVIFFDALIVKFGEKMVMDGTEKALYLWRRVYGENTAPEDGLTIEQPGTEPQRYKDLLELLPQSQRNLFWTNIWQLANDPEKLSQYDIRALYGNVVYSKLEEGLIYVFKITPAGQLYPEVLPDMYK
jgi:hypothetical protein